MNIVQSWQAFWFREVPPHVFALLRIALGLTGLLALLALTPIQAFWSSAGIVPESGGGLGLRQAAESLGLAPFIGYGLFASLLAALTCMTLGYRTTAAVAMAWVLSLAQVRWNPLPLTNAHRVFLCVLFPLLWIDSGQAFSVDSWFRSAPGPPRKVPIWPLRLIRFQIALIYLNSGLSKLLFEQWRDGSAVYYAASSNLNHRFPYAIPSGLEPVMIAGTYLTLGWEIGFAVLLLHRWTRRIALGVGIALHVFMGLALELQTFSLVMLASYLAFLDPDRVPLIVRLLTKRRSEATAAHL